jgi:hypothetical protein
MTFTDVISDIKKLIGLELQSIRPGAKITIQEVDDAKGCLILKTVQGQYKSRPIRELQIIWDEMMRTSVVHVEGVLHGSGTSRNQPETILANLPYIEWLKINNKKHIAFVGKKTHAYGTLKQMDSVAAATINEKTADYSVDGSCMQIVVVSSELQTAISQLQSKINGTIVAVEPGIYSFEGDGIEVLFIANGKCELSPGSYPVLKTIPSSVLPKVDICDEDYYVIYTEEFRALIKV